MLHMPHGVLHESITHFVPIFAAAAAAAAAAVVVVVVVVDVARRSGDKIDGGASGSVGFRQESTIMKLP